MTSILIDNMAITIDNKEFWGKLEEDTTIIKIPKPSDHE